MAEETAQGKLVILIVDNDKFIRTLFGQKLKSEGMVVIEAENGQEALIKMRSEPKPHLALLDLLLPIVDGFEVLRQMQDDPDLKRIPVIVLSNLSQEKDIQRAKNLGAKDYLIKAYQAPGEVIDKIRAVIRQEYF